MRWTDVKRLKAFGVVIDILAAKQRVAVLGLYLDILHNDKSYPIICTTEDEEKLHNDRTVQEAHVC
jgi:hypothetical protein